MSLSIECPICMDTIDMEKNSIVTDCGHTFHCSCLMQNAAHNGFGCPYCRSTMATVPQIIDDDDSYYNETESQEEVEEVSDEALTSFRMFTQRLDGEEVEEELEEELEEDETDETLNPEPEPAYMVAKLIERGITYEDLVRNTLYQEHTEWENRLSQRDEKRHSSMVYGNFRAVLSRYAREYDDISSRLSEVPISMPSATERPEVAENKTRAIPRSEFIKS
jgi:hypothetical protein